MDFSFAIIGFAVGFIVGMTGVGGGSLMTPILVLGFGIKPAVAVSTDLLYAAITKSAGIFVHHKNRNIQWRTVLLLLVGSLPATLLSLMIIRQLGKTGTDYDGLIIITLGIALILTAAFLITRDGLSKLSTDETAVIVRLVQRKYRKLFTVIAGVLIGTLVTISSVGAGVIGTAFLFFLYPRYKTIQIVATDIAHAIPVTFISGIGHAYLGTVNYELLLNLLIGSVPGVYLGSRFGTFLPDKFMRPILATILLLIGIRLLL